MVTTFYPWNDWTYEEKATLCDLCGNAIDWEDGAHIYPDGSALCPTCEAGDE